MASNTVTRTRKIVKEVKFTVPKTSGSAGSNCCSVRTRVDPAFRRSVAPSRVMFYESGSWTDFPVRVVELLRPGFFERKAVLHLEIDGSTYLFDFTRMLQIDSSTGGQRSIAWIDDNGKCFFPRVFVSDDGGCCDSSGSPPYPKIELDIRVDVPGRKRKREEAADHSDDEDEVTSAKRQPLTQPVVEAVSSETATCPFPNVKLLREGERAYEAVSDFFLKGMKRIDSGAKITAIRQCVRNGPVDKARAEAFEKQMGLTRSVRGSANVVHAWYAAPGRNIQSILTHGFGVTGKVVSGSHGVGLHLSHISLPVSTGLVEPDDNGEKHVLLCRVILGNVEKVEAGSKQSYPSSKEFDTGADNPMTPKQYVVWVSSMNRHVLPECVVSYKPSNNVPGSLPTKYSVTELISRVRSSLPPSKVQELFNLVNNLKAGDIARSDFCKQFQFIVGEQLLRSAIPEMRGSAQGNPDSTGAEYLASKA